MKRPLFALSAYLVAADGILDHRLRERRPMATAVVVRTGRYFDRLSNGTLVHAGSRR